jgi:hypothetical protein
MRCHVVYEAGMREPQVLAVQAGALAVTSRLERAGEVDIVTRQTSYLPRFDGTIVDSEKAMREIVTPGDGDLVVIATTKDLGAMMVHGLLFGDSLFARGRSIVSSYHLPDDKLMLGALTTHVAAHSVGLVPATAKNYDKISRDGNHCQNECVMRPINTKQHVAEAKRTVYNRRHSGGFCKQCIGLLHVAHLTT